MVFGGREQSWTRSEEVQCLCANLLVEAKGLKSLRENAEAEEKSRNASGNYGAAMRGKEMAGSDFY